MSARVQIPMKPAAVPARSFTPAPFRILRRKCSCGGSGSSGGACEECEKKGTTLQRHSAGRNGPATVPAIVREVLRSPGQPLDEQARSFFEPRFTYDFSQVRVHADARAQESARAVNAIAYTVGRDVVFGAGQFAPTTTTGQRLLAHELAHVVQQRGNSAVCDKLVVGRPDDQYEREADHVGESVFNNLARARHVSSKDGALRSPQSAGECEGYRQKHEAATQGGAIGQDLGGKLRRQDNGNSSDGGNGDLDSNTTGDGGGSTDVIPLTQGQGDGVTIKDACVNAKSDCKSKCKSDAKFTGKCQCFKSGTMDEKGFHPGWTCTIDCECPLPIS